MPYSPTPTPVVPTVAFAQASTSVNENAGSVAVSVSLSQTTTVNVSVPFTLSGTATSADFTSATTSLTIPAGSQTGAISIAIVDDAVSESAETIILSLGAPSNATLGTTTTHTITVNDNDAAATTGGSVTGRVTDAATGTGISGVAVSSGSISTTTSATGAYTLANIVIAPSVILNFAKTGLVP